jgi:hypothetical protein
MTLEVGKLRSVLTVGATVKPTEGCPADARATGALAARLVGESVREVAKADLGPNFAAYRARR